LEIEEFSRKIKDNFEKDVEIKVVKELSTNEMCDGNS